MQKYKQKQDSCGHNKSTKHQIASISSNKSLLKHPPNNQNKSMISVLNTSDVNHNKSLHHRNKSSKHLESHTFTNNTHQNSVNIPVHSNNHNNSKSNNKGQNQKKKSTGKKMTSANTQSKLLAETAHGRSSSQYQNLLTHPNNKYQVSKNYKNIIKNRKQTKDHLFVNHQKDQVMASKSNKDLKQQNQQKSINVSSFKDLKKKTSKSRSKSKQFQNLNRKSNQSKKRLLKEPSHLTSKQNNMNQGNQKKPQALKKSEKPIKFQLKQKTMQNIDPKKGKQKNINQFQAQQYEKVHLYMLKSSTNSDIEFSNMDQNTVKQLIKHQKIYNKAYFHEGQIQDVFFLKDNYQGQDQNKVSKKQSNKLSKRFSKMNLQLSSDCLNCLTQPDYSIQPKGIRNLYSNIFNTDQQIRSSKQTSQFSSKPEKSSSKRQLSKFRHSSKSISNEQLMQKSAILIQKVWRGYMTRKLLQRFIEEEEMRLFERMKQIDEMKREKREKIDIQEESQIEQYSISHKVENASNENPIKIIDQSQDNMNGDKIDNGNPAAIQQGVNNSVNTLDYESQILPREQAQTISFIVQFNNIASKHINLPQSINIKPSTNQSVDQILYTSVESIDHLSKVDNIYQESQDFIVNHMNHGSQFLKDKQSQQQQEEIEGQQDYLDKNNEQQFYQDFNRKDLGLNDDEQNSKENNQSKRQQSRANFFRQQSQNENIKRYNFFHNNSESVAEKQKQQKQVSQPYQQSSYNEPSSIFYRPSQQNNDLQQINHNINNNKQFQSSKYQEEDSYKINQSASNNEQSYENVNNTRKYFNLQESSYCIADQTDIYQHKHQTLLGQSNMYIERNLNSCQNQVYEDQSGQIKDLQDSYKIDENDEDNLMSQNKQIIVQTHKSENQQSIEQNLVFQSSIPNKSNPNIFLLKSPKHQSLSKSYFSQSKSSKKSNQKQSNIYNIKKTSSLKQFFFKKSLLGNEIFSENQDIQLPIPTFSSHKFNLLAFPTEKQASSIQSLLHFRHQCLTHQHSTQFKEIQQLYVKQKISKQEFILRLQKLACNFESSAVSIKQAQKDIFNGYKALLKLIKDVLKDCKILGLSQEKGSNVRFCRSMEIFFRQKDKMNNQKYIFDDEYLWRLDDVMIDQLDKSKQRLLLHSKPEKSEKQLESMQKQGFDPVVQEQNYGDKVQFPSVNLIENSNKKLTSSPVLQEKQLSRQSLSHHQLPQFFSDSKPQKQNSGAKILIQKDEKKDIFQKQTIVQPCNFDISELASYDDDYFDEDQVTYGGKQNFNETQKSQQTQIIRKREMNVEQQDLGSSSSYDIGEDSLSHREQHQQHALKEHSVGKQNKKEIQNLNKSDQKVSIHIEGLQNSSDQEQFNFNSNNRKHYAQQHKKNIASSSYQNEINEYESLRTTHLKAIPDLHLVINNKNKQFLENQHAVQDLLDEDQAQIIPIIKRQVYQLSCDSDQDSQQFEDKWKNQQVTNQHDIFNGKQRKVHSSNFYERSGSVSLYENNHQNQQQSQLTKKYSSLADVVQQVLIWEFIEEIVLSKNKPQSKTNFGKKIFQIAKSHIYNDSFFNQIKNDEIYGQNNVIIISNNEKSFKRTKNIKNQQLQKSTYQNQQSFSKITCQEINSFLKTLYKQFPTFQQNKSKLSQRMYPSPIQLLRSLRDSSMQDYFYEQKQKRQSSSEQNSSQSRNNHNQQNESSQKSYSGNSNVDSQTSYLELGSYEFLLSQQLCQSLIEKYISEVYDIEVDKKIRVEKEGNTQLQIIKKEFSQYLEMKNIMLSRDASNNINKEAKIFSPSRIPKQGSFQSIIRTRQLFLQHKQIQSQMLRKQILKIQLHTILDSMNQELIKERQSKCGYSGIGLTQLALGTIERSGIQIKSQQQYETLCNKAKYRLQKFVLNDQVNLNDKLLLECQQSVTINDSQWIFYVTEALEFGLQIDQIIQQYLWEQTVREISKMQLKRKFRLDDSWILQKNKANIQNSHNIQQNVKGKKVISINIVDSSEKQESISKNEYNSDVHPFGENSEQKSQSFQDSNNSDDHFESSYEEETLMNDSQQINLPLKMSQQNQTINTQVIETVRNQTHKVDDTLIASSSPIQNEGHINNMNDTTQFDHSHQKQEIKSSNISIPKVNDYSKSFEESKIQNESYQVYQTSQQNINQTHIDQIQQQDFNSKQASFEEDSYQLDQDRMQFDEELDKELDQMNNY